MVIAAAALIAAALYSYTALASNPSAIPGIAADNFTLSPDNVSIPVFTDTHVFGFANILISFVAYLRLRSASFTSQNGPQEANSAFTWFKRIEYQLQNPCMAGAL